MSDSKKPVLTQILQNQVSEIKLDTKTKEDILAKIKTKISSQK